MLNTSTQTGSPFLPGVGLFVRERFTSGLHQLLGLFDRHVGNHRLARFSAILLVYALELSAAFWFAYELRWDFATPDEFRNQCLMLIVPLCVCSFIKR